MATKKKEQYFLLKDVLFRVLELEPEYGCQYVDGGEWDEFPSFGMDLRIVGPKGPDEKPSFQDHEHLLIHIDDIFTFIMRIQEYEDMRNNIIAKILQQPHRGQNPEWLKTFQIIK